MSETDIFDDVAGTAAQAGDIFSDVAGEQKTVPARKPVTFSSLYGPQQGGTPTPSERALRVGAPSPGELALAPKSFDLTRVPRSPFTNQLEVAPPILTEEEKAKLPKMGPQRTIHKMAPGPGGGAPLDITPEGREAFEQTILPGLNENFTLQGNEPLVDLNRGLIAPQNLLGNEGRREHPILTGIGQLGESLTTPANLAILAGSYGIGELPAAARSALSAYFAAQMAKGATDYGVQGWQAYKRGDNAEAERLWTLAAGSAALGGMTGAHAIRESGVLPEIREPVVPKGTISGPLAMDRATARAGRRFADFAANQAAGQGMGRLAEAERGVEAARQARIAAPVEIPPTRGEPVLLAGRPYGPERNPLEVEAAQAREQQAARQAPGFRIIDMRRVALPEQPGEPERPPYFEIASPTQAQQKGLIAAPPTGETIGVRGRSRMMSDLASRVVPKIEGSLVQRFGPDVLDEARKELNAAAGLASSFERPGRYFGEYGSQEEHMPSRSTNAAKGIHASGTWYGVGSARDMIEDMHPWFKGVAEGPETAVRIIGEGKGAAYDRMLEQAATHIQNERESARPVINEYAPRLNELAGQVRDVDPELSQTLQQLAAGRTNGISNLREYIERSIGDAEAAAEFSRAIDEASAEARGQASFEEAPQFASEARGAEDRGEEAAREPARAVAEEAGFPNASAESGASLEAIKRARQERAAGVQRVRIDTRSGKETPLIGPETVDVQPGPYDRIVQRGAGRMETVIAEGAQAKPLPIRAQEPMRPAREEEPAVGVYHLGEIGAVPPRMKTEGVLPGMESAVAEQREAAAREQGRQLSEQINRPPESIEGTAGRMESESPLFRGTEASPQQEMFRPGGDIFDEMAKEGPKGTGGTTFYSNAFLDPKVWRESFPGVTKALARFGETELTPGDLTKGILREQTGELVRRKEQLYKALETKAGEWDARPAKDQLDFILREQRGQKQATSADQMLADRLREMFAERREQIENLGHGAFQRWRENYFPQMWERPNQVRDWITQVLGGKRRMEGPASFKKQRVFDDIQEGIDAGFKPLTTNPVTLALAKLHEMDRYTMAHTTLDSMKKAGLAKAVMVGQQAPAGWERLSEGIGTIYGGGDIPVKEAYDKAVWDRLSEVAKNLGIEHERAVGIGGTRLGYATPGKITTRFATPESVIAHEIGHNLDWKYGLKDQLVKNPLYAKELRALADLHIEGMEPADVPQSFQRYIRKGEEKMATMVEALIHAPDKFQDVAPNTWDFLHEFIADKPELKPLLEAKPSLRYDTRTSPVSAGGIVIHGYYYAPAEAAGVFNNYLSPGLQRFKTYNAVRMVGNTLNQAQLGLSAFHLGFTSIDASVSDMALALERLSRGEVARSLTPAMRSVSVLGSPINTMLKGNKLLREYMEPGKFSEMAKLADAVAQAGGRVHIDPYYKNQAIESFWKAWKEGNYGKAGLRAFPAAMEYAAKPIMEYAVPRMKLGVFANLAEDVLARSDREDWKPEKTRYELNRAWDSVDNRMGQIVYDNLFWNRAVKDLGLVSVRSLGWNLGTAREIGGGAVDTARQLSRLAAGEKAELTHRMAYVMALPIVVGFTGALVHYLSTGKKPETLTDYYFPQTGKIGPNGRPERLSLPSYVKDIVELNQHPARTVLNKVHPAITATAQFLRNEDYYGTEIHHPDDPFLRQRLDDAEFIAKQFLPFSIRNAYQRAESAGGTGIAGPVEKRSLAGTLESMVGLVPAPRSLMQTQAERLAHEEAIRNMPQGPRTREQFEHSTALRNYQNRIRSGDMTIGDLRKEVAAGRITGHDAERIAKASHSDPLEQDFQRLSLGDALDVWKVASPEEKQALRSLLVRKQVQLENMPHDERQAVEKRMREALYGVSQFGGQSNFHSLVGGPQ